MKKLNKGEKLDPKALAEEFDVNLRAIQRDLNERFAFLDLKKADGRYYLNPTLLGKLNHLLKGNLITDVTQPPGAVEAVRMRCAMR